MINTIIEPSTYLTFLIFLAILWTLSWKGLALWNSAQNKQKEWFIIFLVVNTLGILEILYLVFWQKKSR